MFLFVFIIFDVPLFLVLDVVNKTFSLIRVFVVANYSVLL